MTATLQYHGNGELQGGAVAVIRGIHRALWEHSVPVELVTTRMDWSGYKLIFLPNLML